MLRWWDASRGRMGCANLLSQAGAAAAGRLEDKSSLVRKAALQLLGELLASNPFGPRLPEAEFAASLAQFQARLEVRLALPTAGQGMIGCPLRVRGREAPCSGGTRAAGGPLTC